MRQAIDAFMPICNEYPSQLVKLKDKKYLRKIPRGPFILNSASWVCKEAILPNNGKIRLDSCFDVKSGRDLVGLN